MSNKEWQIASGISHTLESKVVEDWIGQIGPQCLRFWVDIPYSAYSESHN